MQQLTKTGVCLLFISAAVSAAHARVVAGHDPLQILTVQEHDGAEHSTGHLSAETHVDESARVHSVIGLDNGKPDVVLVTGATGRTGSLVYLGLRAAGVPVRGLVRNVTKAKQLLHCGACGEPEGIFVGDVTKQSTLKGPMEGVTSLVILSASVPVLASNGSYIYLPGGSPRDVDYLGAYKQIYTAKQAGVRRALLVSSMGTTQPGGFLDRLGHGFALMYKLNAEAALMDSGLAYTIVKPSGLTMDPPAHSLLLAGQQDTLSASGSMSIARGDVAEVLIQAIGMPQLSAKLRFDLSSNPKKPATGDFATLFKTARMLPDLSAEA